MVSPEVWVSMPPRRSCFVTLSLDPVRDGDRFNATTAFLLHPSAPGVPGPRWGFNATTAFLLPAGRRQDSDNKSSVSMPPRRSCFKLGWPSKMKWKACFNATTAFLLPALAKLTPERWNGFNATTAFLLPPPSPPWRLPQPLFQCHHGVPASSMSETIIIKISPGFNATTAFLLRLCLDVSRAFGSQSFNATTAFLLHSGWEKVSRFHPPFQCHHGVPASIELSISLIPSPPFQCHHGVPASPWAELIENEKWGFQCHHGVPASASHALTLWILS